MSIERRWVVSGSKMMPRQFDGSFGTEEHVPICWQRSGEHAGVGESVEVMPVSEHIAALDEARKKRDQLADTVATMLAIYDSTQRETIQELPSGSEEEAV